MAATIPPYTWADVADYLSAYRDGLADGPKAPPFLIRADIYWDQLSLVTDQPDTKNELVVWLNELFPSRIVVSGERVDLTLDGPEFSSIIPVLFEKYDPVDQLPSEGPAQRVAAETRIWFRTRPSQEPAELTDEQFPLFALHSVKGGVGRTTSALALALWLKEQTGKGVLVIDADIEAPGLSYLIAGSRKELFCSLEDLIAAAHADPDPTGGGAVEFVASKITNQTELGLYFLPCFRDMDRLAAFNIRPEHLAMSRPGQSFFLVALLRKLGKMLDCGSIVIDLRAGFTDLAPMVLCAPGVARIFVTTASGQAYRSTCQMIRYVGFELRKRQIEGGYKPAVVFNAVLPQIARSVEFGQKKDEIITVIAQAFSGSLQLNTPANQMLELSDADLDQGRIAVLSHQAALTASPITLVEFVDDLRSVGFATELTDQLKEWVTDYLARSSEGLSVPDESYGESLFRIPEVGETIDLVALDGTDRIKRRSSLAIFAERQVHAETGDPKTQKALLVTPPIRKLAQDFRSELPIAVCIGSKGTGKTFLFQRLAQYGNWKSFASWASPDKPVQHDALILPLYSSHEELDRIDAIRSRVSTTLGAPASQPMLAVDLKNAIRRQVDAARKEVEWVEFWQDAIAWSAGLGPGEAGSGRALTEMLREKKLSLVVIIDGLEQLFLDFRANSTAQAAIRVLISDLTVRLRTERGRPLGLIPLVRSDLVDAAITQNLGQFRAVNAPYALTWQETDILELVAWMVTTSGAIEGLWSPDWRDHDIDQRREELRPVWGRKLGPDDRPDKRTREARTSDWVLAALSDLRGRLTARDLVIFLTNAAQLSAKSDDYTDRLLTPKALRDSIEPVSQNKVQDLREEVPELSDLFDALTSWPERSVPVRQDELMTQLGGLEKIRILEENGVVLRDGDMYEMPELFRLGLGFGRGGARPNIIALINKARQQYRTK